MIKDIFKLKKRSWHMYLMEFLWGLTHKNFANMCPYFWLSVVNVIIAPIVVPLWFIVKTIRVVNGNLKEKKRIRLEEEKEARIQKYKELLVQGKRFKELILAAQYDLNYDSLGKRAHIKSWYARKEILSAGGNKHCNLYWAEVDKMKKEQDRISLEKYNALAPKREKQQAYETLKFERKNARIQKRQKRRNERKLRWDARWEKWNKFWSPVKMSYARKQKLIGLWTVRIKMIAKVLKFVIYVAVVACVLVICYYFPQTDYFSWLMGLDWAYICLWIGIVIICLSLIISIGVGIFYLIEYFKYHPIKIPWLKKILYIFCIFYPFVWIWQGLCWIGRGFKRTWVLLLALKSDNCPAIEWE